MTRKGKVEMKVFFGVLVLLLLCVGVVQMATGEEYVFVTKWGSNGTGDGQFGTGSEGYGGLRAVAADASGNVYTAEWSDNTRIQRFTSTGGFLTSWNAYGTVQFDRISSLAIDSDGYVYTIDDRTDGYRGIKKFAKTGQYIKDWPLYMGGVGVAVDTAGNVYDLWTFSSSGHLEAHVRVLSPTGELLREWGSFEEYPYTNMTKDGKLKRPYGIALDNAGNVYITDTENNRIQKFTSNGDFVTKWGRNGGDGTSGAADGEFDQPRGIAVDKYGDVYVADYGNNRIQKFRPDGTFVATWGTPGSGNGQFSSPNDVDVDPAGNVYVADTGNHRVQKFAPILEPDFTATPKLGIAPLTVQFNDTTPNGQPLSWSWDFGDGGHSALTNPSHTYTVPGRYDVTLTVTNAVSGSRSKSKSNIILVLDPLVANFTGTPRIGYAPLSVQFSDATTGNPTGWEWSFGDGGSSTAQNPVHAYADPGTYRVTLVASKTAGTNSTFRQNYVHVLPLTGPFTIQAEDYDEGGEGVAYSDTTPGNQGGAYRNDSVDIEPFGVGAVGYVIAQIRNGEWTRYTIPSAAAEDHDYTLTLRVSTRTTGEQVTVNVDGFREEVVADLPNTGSLSAYTNVTATVRLHPGTNTLRFTYDGEYTNFDYFVLDPGPITPL
ncbi:MAG: PKD domain-containing protein, partial [Methanospirillum sp.]